MTDPALYLKEELYARMRQDSEIFEFIQSGSLDGIWYWDVEQPENEWMSPEFKALFGYEDHEIPNTSAWWQENLEPGQLDDIMVRFQKHLGDPSSPYDQVVSYQHKDGSPVWVRCRGVAIRDEHGKPVRMLGCHTDVTKLKLAERQLTQRLEELEEANRELTHFSSIISHDLQEPLRKINVFGSMLRDAAKDDLNDEALGYLNHIEKTSKRMANMIRAMIDYTHVSNAQVPKDMVDLNETLHDVLFDLAAAVKDTEAKISIDTLPHVHANAMHMSQLFLNLISNALKFCKPGEAPHIHISYDSSDPDRERILIKDQGIGFDSEAHGEKIFEPFQRLHSRSAFQGTGIGLAACRKIVGFHDGTLHAESTPGEGATFIITLPSSRADQ
jgi:PAS domain S-box-containing protein